MNISSICKLTTYSLVILFCLQYMALSDETKNEKLELLFVQNSSNVKFNESKNKVTLIGVSPNTIFFTDRPKRIGGHITNEGFLKVWNEQGDSFKNDPPNASISVVNGNKISDVIVELSNPILEGNNLTYDIKVVYGEIPNQDGITAVFIDGKILKGAAVGGAGGALVGAISGNAGKGALIGAAAGGIFGAGEKHQEKKDKNN